MSMEKTLEGITLGLCHGKKHGRVFFLDYDRTIFLDSDAKSDPDIVIGIENMRVAKQCYIFDNAVFLQCPVTVISKPLKRNKYKIKHESIKSIHRVLKQDGKLYIPSYNVLGGKEALDQLKFFGFRKIDGPPFKGDKISGSGKRREYLYNVYQRVIPNYDRTTIQDMLESGIAPKDVYKIVSDVIALRKSQVVYGACVEYILRESEFDPDDIQTIFEKYYPVRPKDAKDLDDRLNLVRNANAYWKSKGFRDIIENFKSDIRDLLEVSKNIESKSEEYIRKETVICEKILQFISEFAEKGVKISVPKHLADKGKIILFCLVKIFQDFCRLSKPSKPLFPNSFAYLLNEMIFIEILNIDKPDVAINAMKVFSVISDISKEVISIKECQLFDVKRAFFGLVGRIIQRVPSEDNSDVGYVEPIVWKKWEKYLDILCKGVFRNGVLFVKSPEFFPSLKKHIGNFKVENISFRDRILESLGEKIKDLGDGDLVV